MEKRRKTWTKSQAARGKLSHRSIYAGFVALAALVSDHVNALEESGRYGDVENGQVEVDWSEFDHQIGDEDTTYPWMTEDQPDEA